MLKNFLKNIWTMATAPVVTQILSFFIMPVVARLYYPDDFGLFAIYASVIGPIGVFSTMGYSTSILIPKKDSDASNLFSLSLFFSLTITLISIILIAFGDTFFKSLKFSKLNNYIWLIPVGLLFHGFYMSLRYWNLREKRFKHITIANISRFITNNGLLLASGFSGFASALYLILGDILGGIASLFVLNKSVWRDNKSLFIKNIRIQKMLELAKSYSKYPKYIMPSDLLNQILNQMPVYILAIYFSQNIIGLYALGLRLLTMPINFIGNAIGEVFFQRISENNQSINIFLEKIYKYIVLLAIPVFSFLGLLGEEIFYVFFGSIWSEAGVYSQILCLLIFIKFITIPSHFLMLVNKKEEYSILLNVSALVVSLISLVIGGVLENVYISFILYSISNSLVYAFYGFGFMRYNGLSLKKIFKLFMESFFKCFPLLLILVILKVFVNFNELQIVIISLLALVLYYFILAIKTPELKKIFNQYYFKLKTKFYAKQ